MALLSKPGTLFWDGEATLGNTISGLMRHQTITKTVHEVREKREKWSFQFEHLTTRLGAAKAAIMAVRKRGIMVLRNNIEAALIIMLEDQLRPDGCPCRNR